MSLLPAYIQTDISNQDKKEKIMVPREYELDFETGQLTGNIVEGKEAIKIWIWLALKTPRFRHTMFSWDYGNEIETLIGKGYSKEHIETEVYRMVVEALSVNKHISGITNFLVSLEDEKLEISFIVNTIYGEVMLNV